MLWGFGDRIMLYMQGSICTLGIFFCLQNLTIREALAEIQW